MTVSELRSRASELEITGRSSMKKDELRQAVIDARGPARRRGEADAGRPPRARSRRARSPRPRSARRRRSTRSPPEERLAKHEQSDVDAMGLDKRRAVVGERYGASFAKQARSTACSSSSSSRSLIGGKLAVDELDQGPEVNADKAPWSQADAEQTAARRPRLPAQRHAPRPAEQPTRGVRSVTDPILVAPRGPAPRSRPGSASARPPRARARLRPPASRRAPSPPPRRRSRAPACPPSAPACARAAGRAGRPVGRCPRRRAERPDEDGDVVEQLEDASRPVRIGLRRLDPRRLDRAQRRRPSATFHAPATRPA